MPLHIRDELTLQAADALLHDAPFDCQNVHYDSVSGTFSMILDRDGGRPGPRWIRCRLAFRKVERAEMQTESPGGAMLVGLEYDPRTGMVNFDTGGQVKIALHVSELDGEVADTGEAVSDHAHGRWGCITTAAVVLWGALARWSVASIAVLPKRDVGPPPTPTTATTG